MKGCSKQSRHDIRFSSEVDNNLELLQHGYSAFLLSFIILYYSITLKDTRYSESVTSFASTSLNLMLAILT